jgi:hypothetical protein
MKPSRDTERRDISSETSGTYRPKETENNRSRKEEEARKIDRPTIEVIYRRKFFRPSALGWKRPKVGITLDQGPSVHLSDRLSVTEWIVTKLASPIATMLTYISEYTGRSSYSYAARGLNDTPMLFAVFSPLFGWG